MATVYSDVRTDLTQDDPREVVKGNQLGGEIRVARAVYTTLGTEVADDVIELFALPQGARILYGHITNDDLGTDVNVSIGHAAYTNGAGTAVALDADEFLAATDLSSAAGRTEIAATLALGSGTEVSLDGSIADNEYVVTATLTDAGSYSLDADKVIEVVMFYVVN